ncbi:MMPL family transporter [Streptomyces sp. NPDC093990]|uniref:MMPL family transporter n=1 Tax=Streptomyces sp. NPDC093990 TaxID=3155306 RepID=UPI003416F73B
MRAGAILLRHQHVRPLRRRPDQPGPDHRLRHGDLRRSGRPGARRGHHQGHAHRRVRCGLPRGKRPGWRGGQQRDQLLQPEHRVHRCPSRGVILFLAFGTLLGMLVPLLVATAGVGAGMLTIGLLSRTTTLGTIAPTVAALIGLGVAIDYALFIVVRYRAGLHTGLSPQEAALRVQNTSGRAVLFAGGTVIVALLGMFTLRITPLTGVGLAAVITVLFTVLAAMTLLPALLDVFGTRLLTRRQRRRLSSSPPGSVDTRAETATSAGSRYRWSHLVNRHKAAFSVVAPVVLTVLSLPALSLRLGTADAANDPAGTTTRRAYDLLADGFGPGTNGPLLRVSPMHGPDDTAGLNRLAATVRHLPEIASAQVTPTSTCGAGVWDGSTSSPPDSAASAGASTRSSSRARSVRPTPGYSARPARPAAGRTRTSAHLAQAGPGERETENR